MLQRFAVFKYLTAVWWQMLKPACSVTDLIESEGLRFALLTKCRTSLAFSFSGRPGDFKGTRFPFVFTRFAHFFSVESGTFERALAISSMDFLLAHNISNCCLTSGL
jgi:hypothetical protein